MTSAGAQRVREGVIVTLEGDGGMHGLGEIAPLRTGADTVVRLLKAIQPRLTGIELDHMASVASSLDAADEVMPAVRCGLDIAACDLLAKEAGVPVAEVLGGLRRRMVPVNATISASMPAHGALSARRAVEAGFRCVKLKVGMMGNVGAECGLVGAVRDAVGRDVLIRLDANQAWTATTAIEAIRAFEPFGIEFIEQPVAAGDLEGLAAVRRAVKIPIAADEAVTSLDAAREIVAAGGADLLVVKPMIVAGLRPAMEIIKYASQASVEAVVTTTIDTGVGIAAALHLAASFDGGRACGLATAELLESDLTSSTPQPHRGQMTCPITPGLGVEIDEAKAAPYLERD